LGSAPASHDVTFNHGNPDGKWLYETMRDGSLILRSAENFQVVETHVLHPGKAFTGFFSRDGTRFISCENLPMNGYMLVPAQVEAVVWDTANWRKLVTIPVKITNHTAYHIDTNGRLAAFGLADKTVMVYDLAGGKELARLPVEFDQFNAVEFGPDGAYLAVSGLVSQGEGGGRVAVWNIAQGFTDVAPPKILNADFREAKHVDFSPDGTRLAVNGEDQHGEVWDLATGEQQLLLQGHTGSVLEIHYSHDGRYLVTASADNTVRVWDAASGVQLVAYTQPVPGGMGMAHFSADDQSVIAWGWKEIFYRFIFQDFEQLLEIVRSRVVRGWQPEECRLYLHSETCPELP
jgi:WD40 repeat protein